VRQAESQASFWKSNERLPGAADLEPAAASSGSAKPGAEPLSPELEALQAALSDLLKVKVQISGSMGKGKVTIRYTNEDKLRSIAEKLGAELA
jgi:ParB family chromosome partitioning protein